MLKIAGRSLRLMMAALLGGAAVVCAQEEMPLTLDQEYAQLAERVPGFGGLYLDERGTTHVHLVDLSLAHEVEDLGERVEVHQGQYDFRDLFAWKEEVRGLLSREGMVSLDIDETRNRLVLGAEEDAVVELREQLADLLRETSVPPAAVIVEADELPELTEELTDQFRPIPSGVQIRNENKGGCTLGVNVTRAGVRGFVTNSHCTLSRSGPVESTVFYQRSVAPGNKVGVETVDPDLFQGGQCPAGSRCRYSDAAFVAYDSDDLSEGGNIAYPAYCAISASTLTVSPALPRLPITGFWTVPPAGSVLFKVGKTTGCTLGSLKQTCSDRNVAPDITMLCQNLVSAGVDGGDSGSPVFRQSGNEATLVGLLWGKNLKTGRFIYSPWAFVVSELGIPLMPDAP